MDQSGKLELVAQLASHLAKIATSALRGAGSAGAAAREGATPAEKREDARVAIEYGGLARGQMQRAERVRGELSTLDGFRPTALGQNARVSMGAIVEVESETGEGRTFFLAPAGAGVELTMPGGDGYLSVVTPSSPIGRAVLGRRLGDAVEVVVAGEPREWTITYIG
jgi:transcription elongation GreA/GreB family factor